MLDSDDQELVQHVIGLTRCSNNLIAVFDQSDRLKFANRAFRETFFIEDEAFPIWLELMETNYRLKRGTIITHPDFKEWAVGVQSRRGNQRYRAFEADLHDGRWLWMTETVHANGWMLCVAFDISNLRADERTIREARDNAIRASHTDELTGVSNRRYVMARIDDLFNTRRSRNISSESCPAILDLDNFKEINDRFGHDAGDMVLCDFARRFSANIRLSDSFGRVGGEEFVLIMPNTSAVQAFDTVSRMLELIAVSAPLPSDPTFRYTFSAGIASTRGCTTTAEIYRRADQSLYKAKLGGRFRIELFPDQSLDDPLRDPALKPDQQPSL